MMFNKLTKALIESENSEAEKVELPKAVKASMDMDKTERFCPKSNGECDTFCMAMMSTSDDDLKTMPIEMQAEKLYNDVKETIK